MRWFNQGWKRNRLKRVFKVLKVFLGVSARRPNTKVRPKSTLSKHRKGKSPVSEGEEHRVKNDDETDVSH